MPEPDALDLLLSYHESFSVKGFNNFALCSDRGRPRYNSLEAYIGNINLPFIKKEFTETIDESVYNVPVCTYGGMFFHKDLLGRIGLPDEKYFVYCDDYEFSYRITKTGGSIFLIKRSVVKDIDVSEYQGYETNEENLYRLYYSTRNLTHFKKQLSQNHFLFWVGNSLMKLYFRLNLKKLSKKKISLLIKALNDGYSGRLGKVF